MRLKLVKVLTPQEAAIEQKLRPHQELIQEIEDLVIANLNEDGVATIECWKASVYKLFPGQIDAITLAFERSCWNVTYIDISLS